MLLAIIRLMYPEARVKFKTLIFRLKLISPLTIAIDSIKILQRTSSTRYSHSQGSTLEELISGCLRT
jgi:hypothetical protein